MSTTSVLGSDNKRYKVKVLEDKEFDALPFKHVGDALGCADRSTKTAYVRKTHWGEISKTIDALTLQHELDELVAKHSDHEDEDGIRYKSGSSWVKTIVPLVVGVLAAPFTAGMSLPAAMAITGGAAGLSRMGLGVATGEKFKETLVPSALAGAGGALGGGLGMAPGMTAGAGYGANIVGGGKAALGFGAGAGASASSGASSTLGASTAFPTASLTGASAGTGAGILGTSIGSAAAPTIGAGTSFAMPGASSALLGTGAGAGSILGGTGIAAAAGVPAGISALQAGGTSGVTGIGGTSTGGKVFGALKGMTGSALKDPMTYLGLGSMGMAAMPLNTQTPDIGAITSKWLTPDSLSKSMGMDSTRSTLSEKYKGDFTPSTETLNLIDVVQKDITTAYKQRMKDMDRMGAASNQNWMRSGERLETQRRMMVDMEEEKTRVETEMISSAQQQHAQERYAYVMKEWDVDEQTKRDFLYADIATVMQKYNAKEADVMNLRDIAGKAGLFMTAKGVGLI